MLSVTSLIDMSFLLLLLMLFLAFLYLFSFPRLRSTTFSYYFITRFPLNMTKPSQATLLNFLSIGATPILKQISHLESYPSKHSHLPILTFCRKNNINTWEQNLDHHEISYLQDHIGVSHEKFAMRRLWHRNRTKVFNAPNFKSTIHCQGE